jgi:hypothetical protein
VFIFWDSILIKCLFSFKKVGGIRVGGYFVLIVSGNKKLMKRNDQSLGVRDYFYC